MHRERISAFQLRSFYQPSTNYQPKKTSQYYSRDSSPHNLQSSELYRVPQFANQSFKVTDKPKNKRAHQNTYFEGKQYESKNRTQLSDRKAERKLIDHHYRFTRQEKQNSKSGFDYKELNNESSFNKQSKRLVIDEQEIFSFKELVEPSLKQPGISVRKANTSQSSPISKNAVDLKNHSFEFMNNFKAQTMFKVPEFGKRKVSQKDFAAIKMLGKGKYSKSYLVRQKSNNFICVLKQINKETVLKNNMIDRVLMEIKIHASLKHPNIIDCYGCFETDTDVCLILQYAEEGKLSNIIKGFEQVPETLISHYAYDICMALEYIHSKKVLHRDIKPDNVILSNGVIKIIDFSWATIISPKKSVFCGTLGYAPPEVSEVNQYNESIDLWGLGVILYQLSTGRVWLNSLQQSLYNKANKRQMQLPGRLSFDLKDLIQGLLKKDPNQRLSLIQVWRHPFIKKYNK